MSKPLGKPEKVKEPVEIVVSTYWPTKIIKTVSIKDSKDSFSNTIHLSKQEAKYVFEQLRNIFEPDTIEVLRAPYGKISTITPNIDITTLKGSYGSGK